MKVLHIVGGRPQVLKLFPVLQAFKELRGSVKNRVVHSGQHYDFMMSDEFFDELGLDRPDHYLGVKKGSPAAQTAKIIERLESVLALERPDIIFVYGDMTTTLAGALSAAKLSISIAHVEAGFRSYNKNMPEEVNRLLTDHVSSILFCPSKTCINNLRKEGIFDHSKSSLRLSIDRPAVINTGNVMYDTLLRGLPLLKAGHIFKNLGIEKKRYYVLTIHRAENTDDPNALKGIFEFLDSLDLNEPLIFPVHPRTKKPLSKMKDLPSKLRAVPPLGHLDMISLIKNSRAVLTDSGGLQQESYWLGIPCVTLRSETELVETVESGGNVLYKDFRGFDKLKYGSRNAYGRGDAAKRIVRATMETAEKL
ncbi:MAG: UDP-N-acetylglucosamine 2-epimerase (non-hydrolyzing) [Candidatus Margulisiibacteriota bacterium]